MVVCSEHSFLQLVDVCDFSHCDDGEFAEVGVEDDGLRVGVADYTNARVAFKERQLAFKLGAEICTFETVDFADESALRVVGSHSGAPRAQM